VQEKLIPITYIYPCVRSVFVTPLWGWGYAPPAMRAMRAHGRALNLQKTVDLLQKPMQIAIGPGVPPLHIPPCERDRGAAPAKLIAMNTTLRGHA